MGWEEANGGYEKAAAHLASPGHGLTLAILWSLNGGTPRMSLAQAGRGIICVATTGSDTLACGTFASPFRTPQYAVDLADVGEEIRVATAYTPEFRTGAVRASS